MGEEHRSRIGDGKSPAPGNGAPSAQSAFALEVRVERTMETAVEIVVKGRNVEIPDHYRQHVADKLTRLERYDEKLIRLDVELFHEPNPRQAAACQRVEITAKTRGPVIRAEACSKDFYSALDLAVGKLEGRLRKAADRRRVHHGRRRPESVAEVTAAMISELESELQVASAGVDHPNGHHPVAEEPKELGRVARTKEHTAKPMTLDQALFEMELVGHDFYLFADVDSGRPSVVYRRHGYDYGLITLAS